MFKGHRGEVLHLEAVLLLSLHIQLVQKKIPY